MPGPARRKGHDACIITPFEHGAWNQRADPVEVRQVCTSKGGGLGKLA